MCTTVRTISANILDCLRGCANVWTVQASRRVLGQNLYSLCVCTALLKSFWRDVGVLALMAAAQLVFLHSNSAALQCREQLASAERLVMPALTLFFCLFLVSLSVSSLANAQEPWHTWPLLRPLHIR